MVAGRGHIQASVECLECTGPQRGRGEAIPKLQDEELLRIADLGLDLLAGAVVDDRALAAAIG